MHLTTHVTDATVILTNPMHLRRVFLTVLQVGLLLFIFGALNFSWLCHISIALWVYTVGAHVYLKQYVFILILCWIILSKRKLLLYTSFNRVDFPPHFPQPCWELLKGTDISVNVEIKCDPLSKIMMSKKTTVFDNE